MPDDPIKSLLLTIEAGAIVAVAAGIPAVFLWWRCRQTSLFPANEPWRVPWNGWEVLAALAFAFVFPGIFVQMALAQSDFFQLLYGTDFPRNILPEEMRDRSLKQAANLRGLWAGTIGIPIQIVLIVAGFKLTSGATLAQMGLGRERFSRHYVLGYFGWLLLTPMSFVVFALARLLTQTQTHPLLDLGPWAAEREWIVFAVQAAIIAPINEELLFRGLLLPWLVQTSAPGPVEPDLILPREKRSHICVSAALLIAAVNGIQTQNGQIEIVNPAPFLFVLVLTPLYAFLPNSSLLQRWSSGFSPQTLRGWFGTSILFAAIHSNVWPTPVPLLVLALGLGWLALRSRSIIPSILIHMLFNAVAVVCLRLGGTA